MGGLDIKWKDPRTPVSVEYIGKYKVTIFDQGLYDESLSLYPDDPNKDKLHVVKANRPQFKKQKLQARYN
jgi:hypothetical protein